MVYTQCMKRCVDLECVARKELNRAEIRVIHAIKSFPSRVKLIDIVRISQRFTFWSMGLQINVMLYRSEFHNLYLVNGHFALLWLN